MPPLAFWRSWRDRVSKPIRLEHVQNPKSTLLEVACPFNSLRLRSSFVLHRSLTLMSISTNALAHLISIPTMCLSGPAVLWSLPTSTRTRAWCECCCSDISKRGDPALLFASACRVSISSPIRLGSAPTRSVPRRHTNTYFDFFEIQRKREETFGLFPSVFPPDC